MADEVEGVRATAPDAYKVLRLRQQHDRMLDEEATASAALRWAMEQVAARDEAIEGLTRQVEELRGEVDALRREPVQGVVLAEGQESP
jgi:hypothetical protein